MKLVNIINEQQNDVDEQSKHIVADLGKDMREFKKALSGVFELTSKEIDDAYRLIQNTNGQAQLVKNLKDAAKKDAKLGMATSNLTKRASQELTVAEILQQAKAKRGPLTNAEIDRIVKKNKTITNNARTEAERTTIKNAERRGANAEKNKPQQNTSGQQTTTKPTAVDKKKFADTMKKIGVVKLSGVIIKAALLGATGIGVYWLWNKYFRNTIPQEEMQVLQPLVEQLNQIKEKFPCLIDLLDDEGAELSVDPRGYAVLTIPKTGNEEYDRDGGLVFIATGRVYRKGNPNKGGTFTCNETTQQLSEQAEATDNAITMDQMQKYVDTAVDDLDGWVAVYNLKSLITILKELKGKIYEGQNATQAFLDFYKEDEGGDNFAADVQNVGVRTLGVKGIEYKKQVIKALRDNLNYLGGDNNPNTGIGGIKITWDGETTPGGTTPGGTQRRYSSCDDKPLPHEMYCHSAKISDVQKCAGGIKIDGYYGPNTDKRLRELGYDTTNGITQEVYDSVISKCQGAEQQGGGEQATAPEAQTTAPEAQAAAPEAQQGGNLNLEPIGNQINQNQLAALGDKLYRALLDRKQLAMNRNQTRIVYKGRELNDNQIAALDNKLAKFGFVRTKAKGKNFGEKYVWIKQKNK